jgi:hypothetical protein
VSTREHSTASRIPKLEGVARTSVDLDGPDGVWNTTVA